MFTIVLVRRFDARQGLESAVRRASGRDPVREFAVTMRVGVTFDDEQLDADGRYVDTDTFDDILDSYVDRLSRSVWTTLFTQRPTFEIVSRWLYEELSAHITQMAFVSLVNETIGVETSYVPGGTTEHLPRLSGLTKR